MRAMIMAAGRGERMRPLTDVLPKPLLPVLGIPLIVYHLKALALIGVTDIVINVSHLAEKFYALLQNGREFGVKIEYSYEAQPLDWAGGIIQALPLLNDKPFLVLSGDIFTDFQFENLALSEGSLAKLILVDNPPYHPKGDYALVHQQVKIQGTPLLNYGGIGIFSPELFQNQKPGARGFTELINPWIEKERVIGEYFSGLWYNLGTVAQLQEINRLLEK